MTVPAVDVWRLRPATEQAMRAAQLAALVAAADVGDGNACVRIYRTARGSGMGLQLADMMVEVPLDKPCGTLQADGTLALNVASSAVAGVMVLQSGIPRTGELVAGDGTVLLDGGVTDAEHGGCFQVTGGATPVGDDSPQFYAGGLLSLAGAVLG